MQRDLMTIPKLHGPEIPHPDWEAVGFAPNGKQLFIERFKTNDAVPMMEPVRNPDGTQARDPETGELLERRVYKRHPINGEPLIPMNKRNIVTVERMFWLESEGNNNVHKHFYTPPTPEEIAAAEREQKIGEVQRAFAESLVDAGWTADEVLKRLTTYGPVLTPEEHEESERERLKAAHDAALVDEDAGPPVTYPDPVPDTEDEWRLSDGQVFVGSRESAEEQEALIQQQRAQAKDVPDY